MIDFKTKRLLKTKNTQLRPASSGRDIPESPSQVEDYYKSESRPQENRPKVKMDRLSRTKKRALLGGALGAGLHLGMQALGASGPLIPLVALFAGGAIAEDSSIPSYQKMGTIAKCMTVFGLGVWSAFGGASLLGVVGVAAGVGALSGLLSKPLERS